MMLTYDAIICGAGPAGSIAAASLASNGLKVILIEKQILPRHKTCGGGMPMVIKEFIRNILPSAFVESNVKHMRHTWLFKDPYLASINPEGSEHEISLFMVQRSVFDNELAQNAVKAGAELKDGLSVYSIESDGEYIQVNAKGTKDEKQLTLKARYVIGADGANGIISKLCNLRKNRVHAAAIEIEHPHIWGGGHPELRPDIAHLEYGAIQQGYAWVFPKADHINVGAGIFFGSNRTSHNQSNVRQRLQKAVFDYMDSLNVKYDPDKTSFHAHPLPLWNGKESLQTPDGKILLVGDAAGLVNPFFGDGIFYAIKSGLIAGKCITNNSTANYTKEIHKEFAVNLDTALMLAKFFYTGTKFCYQHGVKSKTATRIAAKLLCGEITFDNISEAVIKRIRESMGAI